MANQFDSKIRFEPIAWRAIDKESGCVCTVIDDRGPTRWSVAYVGPKGLVNEGGTAKNPTSARAKCRRAVERLLKTMLAKKEG